MAFPFRFARANVIIINNFGDINIINYYEIRESCWFFPRYFSICPNPGPTSDPRTSKKSGVFVSSLHYKSIMTSISFVWDIKTPYGMNNDDVPNFLFIPLTTHHISLIFLLVGLFLIEVPMIGIVFLTLTPISSTSGWKVLDIPNNM